MQVKRNSVWEYRLLTQVYEGERNSDKERHGTGKNTFPNGDVYNGAYAAGKRFGPGTYTWKAGHSYNGQYENGLRSGNGTLIYPDTSKYTGMVILPRFFCCW
jgi:radial spoke head protein 1